MNRIPYLDLLNDDNVANKDKISLIQSFDTIGANLKEDQCEELKDIIKGLAEDQSSRVVGLRLFEWALQQKTPFYIDVWPQIVLANLQGCDSDCLEVTYKILKFVLKPSKIGNYDRTVSYHIPQIVDVLMQVNDVSAAGLRCLACCLQLHDGLHSTLHDKIMAYLIDKMNTNSTQVCEAVSDCFILYHSGLTASKMRRHASHETFYYFYKKVLNTLLCITMNITDGEVEISDTENFELDDIFPLPETFNDVSHKFMLLRMFTTYSVIAAKMVIFEKHDEKQFEVSITIVFELISAVMNVSKLTQRSESDHMDLYKLFFPTLHKGAFIILESLVRNFDMLNHGRIVTYIIEKAIEASMEINTFSNYHVYQIRYISWKILHLWICKTKLHISFEDNNKFLLDQLLDEIIPEENSVSLASGQRKQSTSLKSKKVEVNFPPPDETANFSKIRLQTSKQALKILKELLHTSAPYLDEKCKEQIASCALRTAKTIQKNDNSRFKRCPFPYSNPGCRKYLYSLCFAILTSTNFHIKIQRQCRAVLTVAFKDPNFMVKEFCQSVTPVIRALYHPRKKFPEVLTNKKVLFEPPVEDAVDFGWEAVQWNPNHPDNEMHSEHITDVRTESLGNLTEAIGENHRQSNYVSEKEYHASDYEDPYAKEEIQCNGDELSEEVQSDFESEEEMMENDTAEEEIENVSHSPSKPFIATVRSEASSDEILVTTVADSEGDHLSVAEEEQECSSKIGEEGSSKTSNQKSSAPVICDDQNGLASLSEEEMLSSSKGENGEYSSEDEGSYEEEDEEVKEFDDEEEAKELDEEEAKELDEEEAKELDEEEAKELDEEEAKELDEEAKEFDEEEAKEFDEEEAKELFDEETKESDEETKKSDEKAKEFEEEQKAEPEEVVEEEEMEVEPPLKRSRRSNENDQVENDNEINIKIEEVSTAQENSKEIKETINHVDDESGDKSVTSSFTEMCDDLVVNMCELQDVVPES